MAAIDRAVGPIAEGVSLVDLEILRTTLVAYTDELAAVLANAAPTFEISQAREFAVAITDAEGAVVAIDDPQQLGSLAQSAAYVTDYFKFDLTDGDVILTNDPYAGGTRVQDVTILTPLIIDGELVLHLAARVKIRDIGGQLGGSLYPAATEIWAEGHPVTPLKIRRNGRPVRDVLATFLLNGRRPVETRQTIDAAIAALEVGQKRISELVARHGIDALRAALNYAQTYSENRVRRLVADWRPGTYQGSAELGLDAAVGGPVSIRLTAKVDSESIVLDFSESDDQRPVFVNSSAGTTSARAVSAVLAMLGEEVPANSGLLRVVRVVTRPGTVTHPIQPAPVGWGNHHCANEILDTVTSVLQAASGSSMPCLTVPRPVLLSRSESDRGDQTDLGRWAVGGSSAVPHVDGWGPPSLAARGELPSAEQWEAGNDGYIECFELTQDSGGAGQWRGAPGVETVIGLSPDRLYSLWTSSLEQTVDGFGDGRAGTPGGISFHGADGWKPSPHIGVEQPMAADRMRIRLAGGGGYGAPELRERAAVIADLQDGLISLDAARDVYRLSPEEIDVASKTMHCRPEEGAADHD